MEDKRIMNIPIDLFCALVCYAGAGIFFVGVMFFEPMMPELGLYLGASLVFSGSYFVFYHKISPKIDQAANRANF